eukprot:CAMPEP_0184297062 /NCGR_PEP_ID=MMETSP1049-20130417/7985_1 /TAXON_ID=77928 /ORGANISM="Proteomonas sulcata, Strain CCMP704" /LENGTH=269 /DNA_ID=CAMNT_0026606597 /DNA_START=435 /DNA_END=1241 /DNA_ORIENTATION=-
MESHHSPQVAGAGGSTVRSWMQSPIEATSPVPTKSRSNQRSFADEIRTLPGRNPESPPEPFWYPRKKTIASHNSYVSFLVAEDEALACRSPDLLRLESGGIQRPNEWFDAKIPIPSLCEFDKVETKDVRGRKVEKLEEETEMNVKIVRFDHNKPTLIGVGVFFERHGDGQFKVARVQENGPAAASKSIHVGDILTAVDKVEVTGRPMHELAKMVLGTEGSPVQLTFRRTEVDGRTETFAVVLTRQRPLESTANKSSSIMHHGSPSARVW